VRSWVKSAAVLCLLLTLWSAAVVIAHHHANGTESATCTVCVAAHSAAPRTTNNLLHARFAPVFTLKAEPVSSQGRLVVFALSVRPPPAA
jgi:hypothetical protein